MYWLRGLGATVQQQITSLAPSYGIPPAIALAVAQKESSFNQAAVGSSGEIGIFQLMPGTAADLGVNPSDLSQNIAGGLTYLKQMFARFGNWGDALAAYNAGPGNLAAGRGYASSVLSIADTFGFGPSNATDNPLPDWTGETSGLSTGAIVGIAAGAAALLLILSS